MVSMKAKTGLLAEYRELLHRIAMSSTLLEMDAYRDDAESTVSLLYTRAMITDEEYKHMNGTIAAFVHHQNKKILEMWE